ncbi:MAG: tryptophan synthase subunit alpha [Burkholderiales bacterium]|nr:tryptophan synthase subunit alpha [Burkholderiales bacterium]
MAQTTAAASAVIKPGVDSRIGKAFARLRQQERKALIPFVTAGDPDPEMTPPLMHALVDSGADIIELGVPFSDPMADGPTIQRASERALKHGTGLKDVLAMVAKFRATDEVTPVVLMGYANPIEAMGVTRFAAQARISGVDGVLVVDYPPEECADWVDTLADNEIAPIFLLSPTTTTARMQRIASFARGYIYYVSLKGVTGAGHLDLESIAEKIPQIRENIDLPIGVGFGIRNAQTVQAIAKFADAVVIGSRLVEELEGSPRDQALARVSALMQTLRSALDAR